MTSSTTFPMQEQPRAETRRPPLRHLAHHMLSTLQAKVELAYLVNAGRIGVSEALLHIDQTPDDGCEEFAMLDHGVAGFEQVGNVDVLRRALIEGIGSLPQPEQFVMSVLYEHGLNLKEAAAALEVPQSHVLDLHKASIARLRVSLGAF
jgi:DNA-directed RNA polymerase specialized sigma24 family protein